MIKPEVYYNQLPSPQKEICLELRGIIKTRYPDIAESMLWGVPVFNNGMFYLVGLKDHVNLGFTISNLSKEESSLFDGGGKTTRKIEIKSIEQIKTELVRITQALDLVNTRQKH